MDPAPEFVTVRLSRPAAQVLTHWLLNVPERVIPATHPADRQALADLLFALENSIEIPSSAELQHARETLLTSGSDWTAEGPTWPAPADG